MVGHEAGERARPATRPAAAAAGRRCRPRRPRRRTRTKVLRYAFDVAETTLDPQKMSDIYSNIVDSAIFETPLDYDYLARPLKLDARSRSRRCREISADGKTYTMRVKPGIYFTDDPAFKGKKRELVGRGLRLLDQAR